MSSVIINRMDHPWTFVASGWTFSFTLKPLEMRVLSDEEAKAVSVKPFVVRLVDSGLLVMDTPKGRRNRGYRGPDAETRGGRGKERSPDRAVPQ